MSGRYSVEDLLRLRASPLIGKPANLAEIQAVISAQSAQEPANKRAAAARPRLDDALSPSESFQKRPLHDSFQRKSTTDPERIVLGPPRRSFASSTGRPNGKTCDLDDALKDRDTVRSNDRFAEKRSNGRFARDSETEDKQGRRRAEDGEDRPRRPKWAQEEGDDTRREPKTGKKLDQPWFKSERAVDTEDNSRDSEPGWRRAGGGRDRGWGREAPADIDPEWMDGDDDAGAPGRTQADLQRWLQERKAKELGIEPTLEHSSSPPAVPLSDSASKSKLPQFFDAEADDSMDKFFTRLSEQKAPSTQQPTATSKPHGKSRFGALFGPNLIDTQKSASPDSAPQSTTTPGPKETSAGPDPLQQMFGLSLHEKMPTSPAAIAAAGPKIAGAVDSDQAGFARLLEMLQGRSSNPTPPGLQSEAQAPAQTPSQTRETKARVPLYARDQQQKVDSPQDNSSPLLALLSGNAPPHQSPAAPPAQNVSQARRSAGQERLETAQSPLDPNHGRQGSQKDEVLLGLLKQANQAPKPTPPAEQYGHRSMTIEHSNRMAMARNELPPPPDASHLRGYHQGPPEEHLRYNGDPMLYDHRPRRQTSESSRPMYDEPFLETLRNNAPPGHGHGPPPGLGRPPGFDPMPPRMPPPGWNGPPSSQQQSTQGRPPGPPSGMSNTGRPNIPPGYGIPPPQSRDQRLPPQAGGSQPPGPQRKYTGDSGIPMGPPPGFMGNAPPPGLLGMLSGQPHSQQQHHQQHQYHHQQQQLPLPPPPPPRGYPVQSPPDQGPGRQFMDMYGDVPGGPGRNGVRGVGGPMGGYR